MATAGDADVAPLLERGTASPGAHQQQEREPSLGSAARRGDGRGGEVREAGEAGGPAAAAAAHQQHRQPQQPQQQRAFTLLDHARVATALCLVLVAPILAFAARAALRITGRLPKQQQAPRHPHAADADSPLLPPAAADGDGARSIVPRPPGAPLPLRSGYETIPLTAGPDDGRGPPGRVLRMYYELHGPAGKAGSTAGGPGGFPPGEKVVLILNPTGGRCETWLWTGTVPMLCAAGFFPLCVDLRGQGRSSTPEGPYSLQMLAADVHALLARLGVCPHAFGWSLGGGVLLALASTWPNAVRSCAVFGFTSDFSAGFTPPMRLITSIIGSRWYVESMGVLAHGLLLNAVLNAQPTTDSPFSAEALRAARTAMQRSNDPAGYRWTLCACQTFFLPRGEAGLGRIAVPTLMMHTNGDGSVHGLETKAADTASIRLGTMRTYGDDSHMWPFERSNAFNRALLEWIREQK